MTLWQSLSPDVRLRHRLAAALACTCLLAPCLPAPTLAATLEVGPGKTYEMPSAAAAAAHDGDHIVIAPGSYFDCAVLRTSNLTVEGASPEATVITDKTCMGKALFVVQGNGITIRNLTLTRARVPDFNSAGIRAEGGDLLVEHVHFINNQEGILAANLLGKKIVVRDSVFQRNGTCEGGGGCAHGIYVGQMGPSQVWGSGGNGRLRVCIATASRM
jgi:hypothetical protein